tara:strand:+ start:66 stop:752 length:687 start_codon:yes stop_codon:yes gene_type:complete
MLGLGNSITGGAALSAFNINDLSPKLWLAFNTGQVAITDGIQWNDQSGNGSHASQTTDAQEGDGFSGGAFVCDAGSTDNLDFAVTFNMTGAYHVFMVLNLAEESNETFLSSVDNASFMRFAQGGTATAFKMKNGGTTVNITLSEGFGTTKAIAEVTRDSSNNIRVLKNGASLGSGNGSGTFAVEQIGSSSNGMTSAEIHEVVIFNSSLSSANATLVRNDIANRTSISI